MNCAVPACIFFRTQTALDGSLQLPRCTAESWCSPKFSAHSSNNICNDASGCLQIPHRRRRGLSSLYFATRRPIHLASEYATDSSQIPHGLSSIYFATSCPIHLASEDATGCLLRHMPASMTLGWARQRKSARMLLISWKAPRALAKANFSCLWNMSQAVFFFIFWVHFPRR